MQPVRLCALRRATPFLALLLLPAIGSAQRPVDAAVRPIAHSRFVLPSGLVLLLNEDHSAPVIGVEVLYKIGSKDERPGQLGFAHMCEHLMGTGSKNVPDEDRTLIQSIGGSSPSAPAWASTDEDRTHYFYTVPSNQLATVFWMESDRMAYPFTRVTDDNLRTNREIVRHERAQNRDGQTFGDVDRITMDAFFVGQDRHARDALPPMTDLDAASAGDIVGFCRPYYAPNNAVIALSGDFDSGNVRRLVSRYFGSIRRGIVPGHPQSTPTPLGSEKRLVMEDSRARVATLRLTWFTAGFSEADRLPLNLLASLLAPADPRLRQLLPGADRAGRLSKALVFDRQLATSVSAGNLDLATGGVFQIIVTPRGDARLGTIESVIDSVLAEVKASPSDETELLAYKQFTQVLGVASLQTRAARADTLAQGEAYADDAIAYAKQAERTLRITPAEVQAVAKKYLTRERIVFSLIPEGKLDLVSKPELPYTNVTPPKRAGGR